MQVVPLPARAPAGRPENTPCSGSVARTDARAVESLERATERAKAYADAGADPGSLQASLDRAQPGDVIEVGPGTYAGPIRIDKPVILRMAVTYVTQAERPGYVTVMGNWKVNGEVQASLFTPNVPKGARRQKFLKK